MSELELLRKQLREAAPGSMEAFALLEEIERLEGEKCGK